VRLAALLRAGSRPPLSRRLLRRSGALGLSLADLVPLAALRAAPGDRGYTGLGLPGSQHLRGLRGLRQGVARAGHLLPPRLPHLSEALPRACAWRDAADAAGLLARERSDAARPDQQPLAPLRASHSQLLPGAAQPALRGVAAALRAVPGADDRDRRAR